MGLPDSYEERLDRWAVLAVVLLALLVWGAVGPEGPGGAPEARAAERGIGDNDLAGRLANPAERDAAVRELGHLRTGWVRLGLSWSAIEPTAGSYDAAELLQLDAAVDALSSAGIKVMLTTYSLPSWAQDLSHGGFTGAAPPIRDDALDDFERLGEFVASHFSGRVRALECWNEPNLWTFLYPQRTADDPYFGPRTYLRMLKVFHAGVKRGDPGMLVLAGATAPLGPNDRNRTSPQRFARFLAAKGAAAYFDVYSHHPYTPGGSLRAQPEAAPSDPSTTVTLQNLPTLLRLFPTKPFYLTEYAYSTRYSYMFGLTVTQTQQADFLRRAYAYVKRYSQVKLLLWYLIPDSPPAPGQAAQYGVYTGLRKSNGDRKPSWFAFAGGNRITIDAPAHARPGSVIRVTGRLTNSSIGGVAGRSLVLQSRRLGTSSWRTLGGDTTGSQGYYRIDVKPGGSRVYRVVWRGVKSSPSRVVLVY
jgi:hypothetical protein